MTVALVLAAATLAVAAAAPPAARRPGDVEAWKPGLGGRADRPPAWAAAAARTARSMVRRTPDDSGLPNALDEVARSLRSGASVGQALREGHAAASPATSALAPVAHDLDTGRSVSEALDRWRDTGTGDAVPLAASALLVSVEAGGRPARAVDAVAATIREHDEIHREARALATQARASALVIAGAPLGFTLLIAGVDPGAVRFLLGTPVGWVCLLGGLALDALGLWWMMRILDDRPMRSPAGATGRRRQIRRAALVATLVALWVVVSPVAALGVLGALLARMRRARQVTAREADDALTADLPDVIDLVRIAVGAGATVDHACRSTAAHGRGPVRDGLAAALRQADLARPLADSLAALSESLGAAARPFVDALVAAERYGAPLEATLDRLAADARADRRRRAEERARTVPVRLLFPLVACVLPAFGLLTVVPLLVGSVATLTG